MAITLTNITAAVQARGYGTDSLTSQQEFLRTELRRVYGMRRWRWLDKVGTLTTTVGSDSVATTPLADLRAIDAIRVSYAAVTYDDMEWLPQQQLREMSHVEQTDRGAPLYWTQFADTIRIHPRPDLAYTLTVDYGRMPTLPVAATDTIVFPDTYQDMLTWGVVSALAFRQRDWTGQAAAKAAQAELMAEMIREDAVAQRQTSLSVPHSTFWDSY